MNIDKSKYFSVIIEYLYSNDEKQVIYGLNKLKKESAKNLSTHHIFRKKEFVGILLKLLNSKNQNIQNLTLSCFYIYSSYLDFVEEVYKHGLDDFINILKSTKLNIVRQKLMRILCRLMIHESTKSLLYRSNLICIVISLLKGCKNDDTKYYGIKIIRMFSTSKDKMAKILNEKGIFIICSEGLSLNSKDLLHLSIHIVTLFIKKQYTNSSFFDQVINGSSNLEIFKEIYEKYKNYKNEITDIFLAVFWNHIHSSTQQQYFRNTEVLDYLRIANLPLMVVRELTEKRNDTLKKYDERRLIQVLCKFCKLKVQFRNCIFTTLPRYHEGVWMQITSEGGIELFVHLLTTYRQDKELLLIILQALLGAENLHSNKSLVLFKLIEANLLPLISKLFDEAFSSLSNDAARIKKSSYNCYHHKSTPQSTKLTDNKELIANQVELNKCVSKNDSIEIEYMVPDKPEVNCEAIPPVTVYREMNKIKFRTGNKNKQKKILNSSYTCEDTKQKLTRGLKKTMSTPEMDIESVLSDDVQQSNLDETTQYWTKVLEYLLRLLHQIFVFKEDLHQLCKEFLSKILSYIYNSVIIHKSAGLILQDLSKNTSCIQHILDTSFIPFLVVDLEVVTFSKDCIHCYSVNNGIKIFLDKMGFYFSHFHQYGRYEMANRLNPSKEMIIKYSSVVALPHVIRCPSILYEFFIKHKGLEVLLPLFVKQEVFSDSSYTYAIASMCSLINNLKKSYQRKYMYNCLVCEANFKNIFNNSKDKRRLIYILSYSSFSDIMPVIYRCKLKEEVNINCTFTFKDGKVIPVNREHLAMKNQVMQNMLEGYFRESFSNCITINDVSSNVMEMLIHFIYGCTCQVFLRQEPVAYLELLYVAQMYFLPELQVLAVHSLAHCLSPDCIYTCLKHYSHSLCTGVLEHLFCSVLIAPGSITTKANMIDKFLGGKSRKIFIKNVKSGTINLLNHFSSVCNCDNFYRKSYF